MAAAGAVLLACTAAVAGGWTQAEAEKAYWDCEFSAVQGQISLDSAAACSEIYEGLKRDKFDGRFDRFLGWWRENKERELSSRGQPRRPPDD